MLKLYSIGGHTLSYGGFMLREQGSGSLTVTKNVDGYGYDPTKTFEIVATFSKPVTYGGITATTHAVNLAHGQSAVFTDVPENTEYSVTETPLSQSDINAGYAITGITNGSGEIHDGSMQNVSAENSYSALPAKHILIEFSNANYDPTASGHTWASTVTWTRVSSDPNIWECENTDRRWELYSFGESWTNSLGDGTFRVISMNAQGVISTYGMFAGTSIVSIGAVRNTGSVTNMYGMFLDCSYLSGVTLFDTSNVYSMEHMFEVCHSLVSVPLFDTSSVTSMAGMFMGCDSLVSVPLFNTSNVTDMAGMFNGCSSLVSVPLFDTHKVTSMKGMLLLCTSLESVPLFDTGNVVNMQVMCSNCTHLESLPLFDTSKASVVDSAFEDCYNVSGGALALYTQMSGQTNVPTSYGNCFRNCGRDTTTGSAELAQIPSSWGGTGS